MQKWLKIAWNYLPWRFSSFSCLCRLCLRLHLRRHPQLWACHLRPPFCPLPFSPLRLRHQKLPCRVPSQPKVWWDNQWIGSVSWPHPWHVSLRCIRFDLPSSAKWSWYHDREVQSYRYGWWRIHLKMDEKFREIVFKSENQINFLGRKVVQIGWVMIIRSSLKNS